MSFGNEAEKPLQDELDHVIGMMFLAFGGQFEIQPPRLRPKGPCYDSRSRPHALVSNGIASRRGHGRIRCGDQSLNRAPFKERRTGLKKY
jgi:hypothetical protein